MKFVMDIGLLALFLHSNYISYIQMSQSRLLSQSRYVKFENSDMSKFSQSLRPTYYTSIICMALEYFHQFALLKI